MQRFDCVIIGGGIVGLSAAWAFSQSSPLTMALSVPSSIWSASFCPENHIWETRLLPSVSTSITTLSLGEAVSSATILAGAATTTFAPCIILNRISGKHGAQQVDHVAEVHLFVVTRPPGQKLDVIRVRSY